MFTNRHLRRRRDQGVTLVELVMFIVIISIALAGVLQVMRLTTANSADPLRRKQALMIAEAMLEEVQLAKFTYCDPTSSNADSAVNSAACAVPERFGPDAGETRPYDNVNDYVSQANTPTNAFNSGTGVLTDANGNPISVQGYAVSLVITPAALHTIAASGTLADVDALRISVTVSYDDQTVVLDGYRTRYAPTAL